MKWLATLAVAAAALGLSSAAVGCPPQFIQFDVNGVLPKCLLFLTTPGTWNDMLQLCNMLNSSLAIVNGDLHNMVYKHITDNADLKDHCFWIGGTDESREGNWVWEYDDSYISIRGPHWDPCGHEPNGGTKENSLAICPKKFYFSDYPGSFKHYAICQSFI